MSDCTSTIKFIPKEKIGFLVCEYTECQEIATMTITVYDEEPFDPNTGIEYYCSRHAYFTYLSYTEDTNLKSYMNAYSDRRENRTIINDNYYFVQKDDFILFYKTSNIRNIGENISIGATTMSWGGEAEYDPFCISNASHQTVVESTFIASFRIEHLNHMLQLGFSKADIIEYLGYYYLHVLDIVEFSTNDIIPWQFQYYGWEHLVWKLERIYNRRKTKEEAN